MARSWWLGVIVDYFDSAERYDPGLGFLPAWRPQINSLAQPYLLPGDYLSINGSRFRGLSEASGGATNDSATDYPLVQFRRLDNEQVSWLLPDPAHPFSASFFESKALGGLPYGHYLVTVFANAIPSASGLIRFGDSPQSSQEGDRGDYDVTLGECGKSTTTTTTSSSTEMTKPTADKCRGGFETRPYTWSLWPRQDIEKPFERGM